MFKSVPFYKFTDFVVPLIMEQPEPGFDDLLSLWMGNDVQRQYSKWKNNEGRNRTAEEQINKLMAIWQAYMGLKANIVTFIELIEAKNGTKWSKYGQQWSKNGTKIGPKMVQSGHIKVQKWFKMV